MSNVQSFWEAVLAVAAQGYAAVGEDVPPELLAQVWNIFPAERQPHGEARVERSQEAGREVVTIRTNAWRLQRRVLDTGGRVLEIDNRVREYREELLPAGDAAAARPGQTAEEQLAGSLGRVRCTHRG